MNFTKLEKSIKNYNLGDKYYQEVMAIYDELVVHVKLNPIDFYRIKIKKEKIVSIIKQSNGYLFLLTNLESL